MGKKSMAKASRNGVRLSRVPEHALLSSTSTISIEVSLKTHRLKALVNLSGLMDATSSVTSLVHKCMVMAK